MVPYALRMAAAWNKGLTKATHFSVQKISETMRVKKLDNFKAWRDEMKRKGLIKNSYPPLARTKELAELIGVTLGDGHIGLFPRSECLRIVGNSNNAGFVRRYAHIVQKVFGKQPYVAKRKNANAIDITLYEKNMSKRLGIPTGARSAAKMPTPPWILNNKVFLVAYLRGLYEAGAPYALHLSTYTYKLFFSNQNEILLDKVFSGLVRLGFHPHRSLYKIQ